MKFEKPSKIEIEASKKNTWVLVFRVSFGLFLIFSLTLYATTSELVRGTNQPHRSRVEEDLEHALGEPLPAEIVHPNNKKEEKEDVTKAPLLKGMTGGFRGVVENHLNHQQDDVKKEPDEPPTIRNGDHDRKGFFDTMRALELTPSVLNALNRSGWRAYSMRR